MNATGTLRAAITSLSLALSTCGRRTDTTAASETGDATSAASMFIAPNNVGVVSDDV